VVQLNPALGATFRRAQSIIIHAGGVLGLAARALQLQRFPNIHKCEVGEATRR